MKVKTAIICLMVLFLLLNPVSANEITSMVDDKRIEHSYLDTYHYLHTVDFGDIQVTEEDYRKVFIKDNVTFETCPIGSIYYIIKINGIQRENEGTVIRW